MADADLDAVIRRLAKQQTKALTAAVKAQRDRYGALAAKAKTPDVKQRFRQLAKDAAGHGMAAVKRLQMSADNAADAYARAMRKAAEAIAATPPAPEKTARKTAAKSKKKPS